MTWKLRVSNPFSLTLKWRATCSCPSLQQFCFLQNGPFNLQRGKHSLIFLLIHLHAICRLPWKTKEQYLLSYQQMSVDTHGSKFPSIYRQMASVLY